MPPDPAWRRPAARRVLVVFIAASSGWLIASSAGILSENRPLFFVLLALSALTLFITLPMHLLIAHRAPTRRGLSKAAASNEVHLGSIRREHRSLRDRFTAEQLAGFTELALDPRKLRGRLNEEIEVRRRVLRQRVQTILEIPEGKQEQVMLVPILSPLKGELQDDLAILIDDEPIATLPHHEYLVLITAIMDTLLTPTPGSLRSTETLLLKRESKRAVKTIATRRRLTKAELKKVGKSADRIKDLAKRGGDSLILAAILLRRLANNYMIVGIVPKGDDNRTRRTISYERYLIPSLKLKSTKAFLGLLLGSRPKHISLDLNNAATAHSYHLLVMGPEGTYVGWQNLTDSTGLMRNTSSREKLTQPYGRLRRRLGQRYLHLYMRSVPAKLAQQLRLDVKFFEVPPGSLAGAALAAAANFALVLLIALILPDAYGPPGSANPLGSDFPALILAFPAIAGAFVGYDSKTTALVGGTLSSKLSSLATITLSLAASGLFMAQQTGAMHSSISYGVLGIHDGWWQLIVVGAMINTFAAAYTWLARTLAYYWLAHRPDDQQQGPTEQ